MRALLMISAVLILLLSVANEASAGAVPEKLQMRVSFGRASIDPANVNTELKASGIETYGSLWKAGADVTYPVIDMLELGLHYGRDFAWGNAATGAASTAYKTATTQDILGLVARVPIVKTSMFRLDVFGMYGGANTWVTINGASQDGELKANLKPVSAYGGSVGVGYKGIYFFIEGGQSVSNISSFDRTGTVSANIQSMDLSGTYVSLGFMFDGAKTGITTKD